MKAMVLRALRGQLTLEDVPMPTVGPNDALVRVRATGVGLTVVIMTANPGLVPRYPRIPGHQVAAEVVEVGSPVPTVKPAARVLSPFSLPCPSSPCVRKVA